MGWRFAPHFWFLLLGAALANAALEQTGGQRNQWREKLLQTVGSGRIGARAKRSLNIRDKQNLNSDEANGRLLKLFSRELPAKVSQKRTVLNSNLDSAIERDGIPGNLYPETVIRNLEQTSDKVESDMTRKSEIPNRPEGDTHSLVDDDKVVYNIGQDVSLEIPLTTKIEELTKRAIIPEEDRSVYKSNHKVGPGLVNDDKIGFIGDDQGKSSLINSNKVRSLSHRGEVPSFINNGKFKASGPKLEGKTGTARSTSNRRDEVPSILRNSLEDASTEDFQVRDKSADLEIHADSSGVRVKAKPASLQVVSNPHGDVKTLPGETHSEGVVAERRTFTPLLPAGKRTSHHRYLHRLGPPRFPHLPFIRHHHHFHRHHRLPWLRHRQYINYPDVFERMRFNAMPEGPSIFGGMGPPLSVTAPLPIASPMSSMMNTPPPIMSEGPGMPMIGGVGMGAPLIPQLLQQSPTMEKNPSSRYGIPENPMDEMSAGGMSPMGRMNPMDRMSPIGGISPMVRLGPMGDMSPMARMTPSEDMSAVSRMNAMGEMPLTGRMSFGGGEVSPMGKMEQMESMMSPMSPSAPFGQSEMRRRHAVEFWGLPNQDQLRALARGENVQKVLGSNRYGESLGAITPGVMNPLGGMSSGMGGASFNANGMGENMMGAFGGSGMFNGMPGGMSNMMGTRGNMLYKKDSIDKTGAYKKSVKVRTSGEHKADESGQAVSGNTRSSHGKFEEGILKKAQSLVAGEKHIAKNEESELHREHRIRKSSKLAHDEERRSLDTKQSENPPAKHQKTKNVKGSKKDVAVQRPPIIYHPPPEVFHRPDIVLHRPPVLFHRPPIVYHQAPVVVHRPAVVYRQSPIVFHQPNPLVSQPYYRAWDNFQMNPVYAHVGSHVAPTYNYLGVPPEVTGYRKGIVPHQLILKGAKVKSEGNKETKRMEIPERKEEKKGRVDKNEKVAEKKKKDVVVNRPPIIYHPPPEVYHRPQIVVHRAPLLIRRPPVIYHQPAVIVHRPPVVYHQPPLVFHQPTPTVNQPVLYSHDNFVVHPSFFATHHGSIVSDAGRLLGIPNTVSIPDSGGFPYEPVGANPMLSPGGLGAMGMPPMAQMGRRKRSVNRQKKAKHENAKRKNAVVVKRPPIVYHPPSEVYHRPDIVVHRAPLVIHRKPIIYHQAPVVVHRPAVVYHQPPVMFHQPQPMVAQPTFASHDVYTPHQTLTFSRSTTPSPTYSVVALVATKPTRKPSIRIREKSNSEKKDRVNSDSEKKGIRKGHESDGFEHGSKKGEIARTREGEVTKKNAVMMKRPLIVYHPPPEVYHRPDIVVHRAPLVIHRSPIIYHQAPVVVHKPAVVYHQPPVLFHQPPPQVSQPVMAAQDVFHETSTLTPVGSSLRTNGAYLGIPTEVLAPASTTAYGKSKVPRKGKHRVKSRRDVTKEEESGQGSKKAIISNQDETETASKKNAVLVKRPPIIYHPPPEVYHRPDIVVHRAPIVIHRSPLVYHQAPVIVHRPAVVYHQPGVVFHQPSPMVHQPMFTAHDTFTPHDSLVLEGSTTQNVGNFEGPPPEMYATKKGEMPKNAKGTSRNTIPIESKDQSKRPLRDKAGKKHKGERPYRRSHLRKLIISLQKDGRREKKGLQVAGDAPLVLQRPPLILSRPAVVAPTTGHSFVSPMAHSFVSPIAHPLIQRVLQPVPIYQPVVRQVPVPVPVVRHVPVPVVYHHHHWPVHFYHSRIQPVMAPPPHYTTYSYHPYSFGKSHVPHQKKKKSASEQKDTIHVYDYAVPAHGHVGHVNGDSHVVTHHGYVTRHAGCPNHCATCQPLNCPSDCNPHCIAIIHHQHHRPHHVFVNHDHHHSIAQSHFHEHHWPVHHYDVYYNHPYFPHRHIGYPSYHLHGRRDTENISNDADQKTSVPHYKVYQHVKHWYPPCIHHSQTCHHHHHPMTIYHGHHHPISVLHHHHYTPYPVYHNHEHIKPVIYHHLKPYPVHHHHDHLIQDSWHHDYHHHYHVLPPTLYPVPISIPTPVEVPIPTLPISKAVSVAPTLPIASPVLSTPWQHWNAHPPLVSHGPHVLGRSHVPHCAPHEGPKTSQTFKNSQTFKSKNKKKDVVVNRPPIIYHPPPEVYHRPEIVVHRAPVLIHRPPVIYHQPAVIVHRPPVVYHQSPIVFHQPAPTVNQPILYSHDNFVVHPTMLASHAGTMVESAGHFLGVPNGPISNFPDHLPSYGSPQGFGMEPYATPWGRKRRSAMRRSVEGNGSSHKRHKNLRKKDKSSQERDEATEKGHDSKKADRKNAIVVHRPPVIYHPPPEIYHRPRVVVHRPDVLIHHPPIVYHQSPVVLHRPPVVYHQTPLVFHQPPPMINQPVYHSHDAYTPHPVFTHYDSAVQHVGSYHGVPPYGYHDFGGLYGGLPGFHGGFGGYPALHGGIGGLYGGFGVFHGGFGGFHPPFAPGFGRSKIEKPKQNKKEKNLKKDRQKSKERAKNEKAHRKHSVVVHRPPVIFHPAPEIYHRPAYVIHQPDVVIHRPPTVYHQSPVVVHHPPIAYHQHPVVYHQPPPVFVQPTLHHHQFFHECGGHECYGGGPYGNGGCFGQCDGGYGSFGHGCCGGLGGGFHGGFPFLYGKSSVPEENYNSKKSTKQKHKHGEVDSKATNGHYKALKENGGSKKNSIVIHRPPLVYHPPPEIYHRPDIVVHRPDVLIHRPSIVYDQPAVVLHRPAVIYHEPDVVFHQPPPLVNLPVYHASDMYAPHPVLEQAGSQVDFDHDAEGIPPHFSFGPYGVAHAFGKSKIEGSSYGEAKKDARNTKAKERTNHSEKSVTKESGQKIHHASRHTKEKSKTTKAHKKYHLVMHRPPIIYHPSPTIYHRPDVVVHQPDIVIHRPSVVVQPSAVIVHKPAVVYHQPPVVFHQPEPTINQPLYHSHDAYEAHPVYTHVASHFEHGGEYLAHPGLSYKDFGFYGYGDGRALPGFGKSKIQKTKETHGDKEDSMGTERDKSKKHNPEHDKNREKRQLENGERQKKNHEHDKRDTQSTNTKRVELPRAQNEKTETGTKKNAIVVRRPPIIYHPPPEVYHRPDIVVHRAPIVIQRAPLVYHQSPVIVHRPAVVYHQPEVVFHQPAPTVHQPLYHSVDTFSVHPHLSFSQAGSTVHQVGEYMGIPEEVMHRSTVPSSSQHESSKSNFPNEFHPKQRRATIVEDFTPVTPLNFVHPRHPRFEAPRSRIPYPTLHPHSLSYSSFPWGNSPRTKRSVGAHPYPQGPELAMVPHELFPLPYSPYYHPTPLQRPHVNVNIETVRSNLPKGKRRQRRQSLSDPSQLSQASMQSGIDTMQFGPIASYPSITSYPNLPKPHVNVNVETIKSAVPRNRRQIVAGLPAYLTQPELVPQRQIVPPSGIAPQPVLPSQSYSQAVVPVSPAQLTNAPDEQLGVYRDLIGAIYPKGIRRRPKVNIVVQTAKSNIAVPQYVKKSVVPNSLSNNNVDAFSTMPEVTTIEPPLLRDGVRVNMVDMGDPTTRSSPTANFGPHSQPSYGNLKMQNFRANVLGLGAQGNFGIDKWRKSTISEPITSWHDVNAEKKSAVRGVHRDISGQKRFVVSGFQSPQQYTSDQLGHETQGSIPLTQSALAGYNAFRGDSAEPQNFAPQATGIPDQGQPESANPAYQVGGFPQPAKPQVNVNIESYKKHTLGSNDVPSKRQLIATLPQTSLFRPNPYTLKASLKSVVPGRNPQHSQLVPKRQQIMHRAPLAQAIPQLRNWVTSTRRSPLISTPGYTAFPVHDTQPQSRKVLAYPRLQSASPIVTPPPSQSYVALPSPSPYTSSTIYPWAGRRPHVNNNIETTQSNIPVKKISSSLKPNKIITSRFKREFPVLYSIIKAKAQSDTAKRYGKKHRAKRQIPMFVGRNFLQSLIPDPNLLEKRAFFGNLPRYPMNPAVLTSRASRPRPEKQSMGAIEVGGDNYDQSPLSNAASFLKNEFSQSFDDIAKIQSQEVNAIKGMNMGNHAPTSSVMNIQEQASPGVVTVPGQASAPGLTSAPAVAPSAIPVEEQGQPPQVVSLPAQRQTLATYLGAPPSVAAAGQALQPPFSAPQAPVEIAPGFVRGNLEPQAVQTSDPELQATGPSVQAVEPAAIQTSEQTVSKKSPFTVMTPEQLSPGLQPQFAIPNLQLPFLPPAELPSQAAFVPQADIPQGLAYARPFLNPIPQSESDDSDRPSVNIQVQTSKSKIPKISSKKKGTADHKKKPY